MKSNNALIVILGTVTLDAVGIGLVMPVLPGLLRDIVHSDSIASHYGVLLALYALMQFLCAPVLGALSDRFGRRPVLLASLLGATIDYAIMATTPVLWILYAGRIVAGITGATGAVAGAYIADITDGEDRARHFGLMSACFGVGMVAGPVAGGLLGAISLHAPFLAAAVLNGLNLLLGCFLMQECWNRKGLNSNPFGSNTPRRVDNYDTGGLTIWPQCCNDTARPTLTGSRFISNKPASRKGRAQKWSCNFIRLHPVY